MQIYFLSYLLFYIKLVQIVVKTFSFFLDNMWKINTIFVLGRGWVNFTYRVDLWFEEDGPLFMETRQQNLFG
jgi:hypothetical protein